jgi:hypothetical protein
VVVSESQFSLRSRVQIVQRRLRGRIGSLRPENGVKIAVSFHLVSAEILPIFVGPVGLDPTGSQANCCYRQNCGSSPKPTCARKFHSYVTLLRNVTRVSHTRSNPRRRLQVKQSIVSLLSINILLFCPGCHRTTGFGGTSVCTHPSR